MLKKIILLQYTSMCWASLIPLLKRHCSFTGIHNFIYLNDNIKNIIYFILYYSSPHIGCTLMYILQSYCIFYQITLTCTLFSSFLQVFKTTSFKAEVNQQINFSEEKSKYSIQHMTIHLNLGDTVLISMSIKRMWSINTCTLWI